MIGEVFTRMEPGGEAAARAWDDLRRSDDPGAAALLALADARPLLEAVFAGSPFLTRLILGDPEFGARTIAGDRNALVAELYGQVCEEAGRAESEAVMRRLLRQTRARAALLVGLADVSGAWTIDEAMEALTRFAEACLNCAVDWLLRDAVRGGRLNA